METESARRPDGSPAEDPGIAGLEPMLAQLEKRLDALIADRLDAALATRRQAEREDLLERFAADNPDFRELLASGALAARKRDNPLLDDVGAYLAHRLMTERQAAGESLATARAEAEAAAEARVLEGLRTKRLARTLAAGPAGDGRGAGVEPELAAPEKFGGINAVLAARLAARRRIAGI